VEALRSGGVTEWGLIMIKGLTNQVTNVVAKGQGLAHQASAAVSDGITMIKDATGVGAAEKDSETLKLQLLSVLSAELSENGIIMHAAKGDVERRKLAWLFRTVEDFIKRVEEDDTIGIGTVNGSSDNRTHLRALGRQAPRPAKLVQEPLPDPRANDIAFIRSREIFVSEGSGYANVGIVRVGALQHRVEIEYSTAHDKKFVGSSGSNDFKALTGSLVFEPGEAFKDIVVPITNDDQWETIEHFHVQLKAVISGPAEISEPRQATVFVVDDDQYPRNIGKDPSGHALFMGFLRERWKARWPKPFKTLLCMFYATIHGLMGIFIPKFLIDEIISSGELNNKRFVLVVILTSVYALSALMYWKLDYKHVDIRGRSGTRKDFRNWIIQKVRFLPCRNPTSSILLV
jgi:hypothetical protein